MSTAAARVASATARARAANALRGLASGEALVDALVAENDSARSTRAAVDRVKVERLLRAVPGIGEDTAVRICRAARVDRVTRVGALTPARRRQLASAVAELDLQTYRGTGPRRRAS